MHAINLIIQQLFVQSIYKRNQLINFISEMHTLKSDIKTALNFI